MATIHECLESGYSYCDALQNAFDSGNRAEFERWLELQRNWLLVGLREVFAFEENDEHCGLDHETVLRLLAESNDRHTQRKKQRLLNEKQ